MHSPLMNKYFRAGKDPVTEGWGMAVSLFIPFVGFGTVAVSYLNIRKTIQNPAIQKYVIKQCEAGLAKMKKSNKNLSPDCPSGIVELFKKNPALLAQTNFIGRLKNPSGGQFKVGKFTVVPFGDTNHVEKIVALFHDTEKDKYVGYTIPAPTSKELQELGLRKEEK